MCSSMGAAVAAALQHGRLAVLRGTHLLPMENPSLVNAVLLWFLAGADLRVPRPTFHLLCRTAGVGTSSAHPSRIHRCPVPTAPFGLTI
jgi:hypothetical protein